MLHPDYCFVDCALGDASHRNHVLDIHQVLSALPEARTDCYMTWRRFPEAYRRHWQATAQTKGRPSVAGYDGPAYSDYLPFDFDDADLKAAHNRVRAFLQALQVQFGVEDLAPIRCHFSGAKGFHVLLPAALFGGWTPSAQLPAQQRRLALNLGNGFDIDEGMYDVNRMLRLNNTRNSKSGLFKIPLTCDEVLTHTTLDVLKWAEGPREVVFLAWDSAQLAEGLQDVWKAAQRPPRTAKANGIDLHQEAPDYFPLGLADGQGRDNAAFTLAAACRNQGCQRAFALEVVRCWNRLQADPLDERTLQQKIDSAYGGRPEEEAITPDDIKTPAELLDAYRAYVELLQSKRLRLGFPDIDKHLRAIAPGEVITVIARSAVGKTAFLQNVLVNIAFNQHELTTLFCSMEQPLAQCAERYAQMIVRRPGAAIERAFRRGEEAESLSESFIAALGPRTLTCGRPGLRMSHLDAVLDAAQLKGGRPVDVLAVDYLGMHDLSDLGRDTYAQVSAAAKEYKRLALRRQLVVLLLCQVSRKAGEDGDQPLTRGAARDSGAIEESADYLLGLYRPDFKSEDETLAVQILKNRKGFAAEVVYPFNRETLRVGEPPTTQESTYEPYYERDTNDAPALSV